VDNLCKDIFFHKDLYEQGFVPGSLISNFKRVWIVGRRIGMYIYIYIYISLLFEEPEFEYSNIHLQVQELTQNLDEIFNAIRISTLGETQVW